MSGKIIHLFPRHTETSRPTAAAPLGVPISRRSLYRVRTATLNLRATVRANNAAVRGRLINISAGGCCVRVALPLPAPITIGVPVTVSLLTGDTVLVCAARIVGIDPQNQEVLIRVQFSALAPGAHRALLTWISRLAAHDFQQRFLERQAAQENMPEMSKEDDGGSNAE